MLITMVSFLVVLMALIFVHELGHFLAAKLVGVKVEAFSLGFPPKLISKKIGETEYRISVLPLGGYVKLYGENPLEAGEMAEEDKKRSFTHKPFWAKMIVILAGPIFNLIFAFLLFVLLTWWAGIGHLKPILGPIEPQSPAQIAGLSFGDEVLEVNGQKIKYFDEIEKLIQNSNGQVLNITVEKENKEKKTYQVEAKTVTQKDIFGDEQTKYQIGISSQIKPFIGEIIEGKAADKGGLKSGDLILTVNNEKMLDWQDVIKAIRKSVPEDLKEKPKTVSPLQVTVKRGGEFLDFSVIPDFNSDLDINGNMVFAPMFNMKVKVDSLTEKVGFFRAVKIGYQDANEMIKLTVIVAANLLRGKISVKTLGGPILIAEVTGSKAREGILPLISLAAFISINLGVLNLLPLPVLDGGQFLIFLVEAVTRKPLNLRIMEILNFLGIGLLILLMVTVFYNDISRLVKKHTNSKIEVEVVVP